MKPEIPTGAGPRWPGFPIVSIVCACLLTLGGCKPDLASSPAPELDSVLWTLTLNHRVVLLSLSSPYDTVQLVATPRNVDGIELEDIPEITYTALDTTIRLSETGLVRASSATPPNGARVVVKANSGLITLIDTAFIHIRNTSPIPVPLRSFTLFRTDADSLSATLGVKYLPQITDTSGLGQANFDWVFPAFSVRAIASNGDPISVPANYTSSDNTIASINRLTGAITKVKRGTVTLTATAHIYGTTVRDTVRFRIGLPIIKTVSLCAPCPTSRFSANVGVGAAIAWQHFLSSDSASRFDVIFEDSSAVSGVTVNGQTVFKAGNIIGLRYGRYEYRVFNTPGVYPWRTTTSPPITGTVVVTSE